MEPQGESVADLEDHVMERALEGGEQGAVSLKWEGDCGRARVISMTYCMISKKAIIGMQDKKQPGRLASFPEIKSAIRRCT